MLKFVAGMATGWVMAKSLTPNGESPFKPPTWEECLTLSHKIKIIVEDISKQIEQHPPKN